jgi:hypothetical protein
VRPTFNPTAVRIFLTAIIALVLLTWGYWPTHADDIPDWLMKAWVTVAIMAAVTAVGAVVWMIWS